MTIALYILTISTIVGLDQITKYFIVEKVPLHHSIEVIKNFFNITYAQNTGAAFSMLKGKTNLFFVIVPIAIMIMVYLLIKSDKKDYLTRIGCLFVIGGAIGNLIDRIANKYVIDFLDFKIFGYDFPVFNVADCFVTIGVILIILSIILESRNAKLRDNN